MSKQNNLKDFFADLYQGIVRKKPDASRNPQDFRAEIESIGCDTPAFDGTIEIDGEPATDYIDYYEEGKTEGFADGKEAGIAEGYQTGYTEGESAGFEDGYGHGYTEGNANGYISGKADGYTEGNQAGYIEGKQAEYDAFWDAFQQNGNRTDYANAFYGQSFDFNNFFPKYDMRPTGYTGELFYAWTRASHSGSLIQRLKECGVVLDTSNCTSLGSAFAYTQITEIPTIDCTALSGTSVIVFAHGYGRLKKIEKLIVKEGIEFTNWFLNTYLEEVIFEGVISTGSLNLQWATGLNKASWISIINTLSATTSGLSMTGSLESVNTAFETSAGAKDGSTSTEWLNLIATKSNWTINLV